MYARILNGIDEIYFLNVHSRNKNKHAPPITYNLNRCTHFCWSLWAKNCLYSTGMYLLNRISAVAINMHPMVTSSNKEKQKWSWLSIPILILACNCKHIKLCSLWRWFNFWELQSCRDRKEFCLYVVFSAKARTSKCVAPFSGCCDPLNFF